MLARVSRGLEPHFFPAIPFEGVRIDAVGDEGKSEASSIKFITLSFLS